MTYRAKDSLVHDRQLKSQVLHLNCNLVAGTSDDPAIVSIDNSTLTATEVAIDVKEDVQKVKKAQVVGRTTGAVTAIDAVAVSGSVITITIDGTGLTDVDIEVVYEVVD